MNPTYLVSFPRSGNTWMRFLLANVLYPNKDVNYISINDLVPDSHQVPRCFEFFNHNYFPVVKRHTMWEPAYSKVIYLYRDVRDVALSCYHFDSVGRDPIAKGMSFDRWLDRFFIGADDNLVRSSGQFGRWDRHVSFWLQANHRIEFTSIAYEDLSHDTSVTLKKIIDFLDIKNISSSNIKLAIKKSDFRELEKIRARDGVDPKIKGLRGRSGGWKEILTKEQVEKIWSEFGATAEQIGYKK